MRELQRSGEFTSTTPPRPLGTGARGRHHREKAVPHRAPTPCTHAGCGNLAEHHGRCGEHPHPHRWGQRPRERERYGLTSQQRRNLWASIRRRDHHRCYQCGQPGTQIDHVMPLAEGGARADPTNLAVICGPCHQRKNATETARSNQRRAGPA